MKRKKSEVEFKNFCKRQGLYWHKFADILICPVCRNTIWQSNKMPDFEVTYCGTKTLVEVKQGTGKYGAWNFGNEESGIRPIQRDALFEWKATQNTMPWLFLVLGTGRAPKGRGAFLIPWTHWVAEEKKLLNEGQKSIRFTGGQKRNADVLLAEYRLDWIKADDDFVGGWSLPWGHIFYTFLNVAETTGLLRSVADFDIRLVNDIMENINDRFKP